MIFAIQQAQEHLVEVLYKSDQKGGRYQKWLSYQPTKRFKRANSTQPKLHSYKLTPILQHTGLQ